MKKPISLEFNFWPSKDEIKQSKSANKYVGGLEEFIESIDLIKKSIADTGFEIENKEIFRVYNLMPEIIQTLFVSLPLSGTAIALYKLLKLWIMDKNGRRIKVKIGDFELETTQLTDKQFVKLIERISSLESKKKPDLPEAISEIIECLKADGWELKHFLNDEKDFREISELTHESIKIIREKK
jgi:hypothetical protein